MIRAIFISGITALLFSPLSLAENDWQTLLNGKDLTGWDGDPRLWRVEDGVLIGETDATERKIAKNSFLIWQGGDVADFELEFQARVTTDNNSGVQYRSKKLEGDGWRVTGYQMDLHPSQSYLAMLYEEGGRGIVAERGQHIRLAETKETVATMEVVQADLAEWQTFRIVAKGQRLEHHVNGKLQTVIEDADEKKRANSGIIAIQLHQGAPMKVEFKSMRLRTL